MGNCANKPLTTEGEKAAAPPEPKPEVAETSAAVTTEEKVVDREVVVDELKDKVKDAETTPEIKLRSLSQMFQEDEGEKPPTEAAKVATAEPPKEPVKEAVSNNSGASDGSITEPSETETIKEEVEVEEPAAKPAETPAPVEEPKLAPEELQKKPEEKPEEKDPEEKSSTAAAAN